MHVVQSPEPVRIALLQWYAGVHSSRNMPWRKPYDPLQGPEERSQRAYEVWVSEIMLQQTQVATVIPYYTRWMGKFPTIRDLAAANIEEVNALWKGLGYYSRASRLLAGAQKAVTEYQGRLPDNAKDLEANIPGIGRYSAGAIASIAYGEHVPVLDGNVHRLMSRILALHAPPKAKATLDILWAAAAAMVTPKGNIAVSSKGDDSSKQPLESTQYAGDINQALIELGSIVCKVRDPLCKSCPLRPWCRAYGISTSGSEPIADIEDGCTLCEPLEERAVTAYPMKADRKKPREELDIVNVVEWCSTAKPEDRWFLMVRRPKGGLLAGLYEFPTSSNVTKTTSRTAQTKIAHELLSQLIVPHILPYDPKKKKAVGDCLRITSIKTVEDVVHVFSHIRKTYRPQWVVLQGGKGLPPLDLSAVPSPMTPKPGEIEGSGAIRPSTYLPVDASWVRLKDVPSANMGTGVVKVWNSTRALWEVDIDGR
ncbi:putative DNA glycosylase [Lyophyllum shimeji]|uniref:Adenine DNA glycosylase n=1 Tax=Lyophyllum shimeji TaxID=47721 RepID=A0A9P3UN00_LYOSH|nr:putative DNA glycosylase [Lyophyllum shimeji]